MVAKIRVQDVYYRKYRGACRGRVTANGSGEQGSWILAKPKANIPLDKPAGSAVGSRLCLRGHVDCRNSLSVSNGTLLGTNL